MSMENPMNNVKPDEVNKPPSEPIAKSAGEARKPERNFKIADGTAIKISEYKDIADLFAARAENLFKENQKRSKALGIKGFDKTSTLYRQWFDTTQVVKLADKIANIYSNAEASAADIAEATQLEQKIKAARIALDLTREEAWDESTTANALSDRWTGIETPKQPAEKLARQVITDLQKEAAQDDAEIELAGSELKDRWTGTALPKKESLTKLVTDISLADGSVKRDEAALRSRRDAEKVVAEQLAMKKQIEAARKEA